MPQHRLAFVLIAALAGPTPAGAAVFSYHGELLDAGAPAQGRYDLRVRAFAQPGATQALGEATELPGVELRDGKFSVQVDVPEDADGTTWLEVAVRKAASGDDFVVLGAPQPLAKANSTCPGAWALDGNTGVPTGSFLGYADTSLQELSFHVRGNPAMRLIPTGSSDSAPNIVAGLPLNQVRNGVIGGTISGGGAAGTLPLTNQVWESYGTVAGGYDNQAGSPLNGIGALHAGTVGGGSGNRAVGINSTIPGGRRNQVFSSYGFAAGYRAFVSTGHPGSFVWADDSVDLDFETSGPRQFLIRATGGVGINTTRFGAAPDLRLSEMVVRNPDAGGNVDITLLNQTNRGYGVASIPGANGAAGDFYISETDARSANVVFTNRFRIDAAGTTFVQGGAVGNLSDARLKKNVAEIERPLDTLLALHGRTFEYIDPAQSMNAPGPRMGFIAQDVQRVLPGWVRPTGKDGYLAVTPIGFEALAVEAMRDLKAENEVLRETVARLQAQVERLAKIVD